MTIQQLYHDHNRVHDLQKSLVHAGVLDPVFKYSKKYDEISTINSDGILGPNTEAAMRMLGIPLEDFSYDQILEAADNWLPSIGFHDDFTQRLISNMLGKGYHLCTLPGAVNIVYLEGVSKVLKPDSFMNNWVFSQNDNEPDQWNDLRCLIKVVDGKWRIVAAWEATTGPGMYYTVNPMNRLGAARIQFGQYKAWQMGKHNGVQDALQHCDAIMVCRDLNKDFSRKDDSVFAAFATINQHTTTNKYAPQKVGKYSAGCLVGQVYSDHLVFMSNCLRDPRYVSNTSYKFVTTVVDGKELF